MRVGMRGSEYSQRGEEVPEVGTQIELLLHPVLPERLVIQECAWSCCSPKPRSSSCPSFRAPRPAVLSPTFLPVVPAVRLKRNVLAYGAIYLLVPVKNLIFKHTMKYLWQRGAGERERNTHTHTHTHSFPLASAPPMKL